MSDFIQLYDSDIATIAEDDSHTTDSREFITDGSELIAVQVKASGENASIAGKAIVKLVASLDRSNYDTQIYAEVSLDKTTNTEERATGIINVAGLASIRVTEIQNTDSTYDLEDVNVFANKVR